MVAITPGYFRTFAAEILDGRDFMHADDAASLPVTIVNLSFVDRFFPGQNPLGRRIRVGSQDGELSWMTVIGVVPDLYMGGYLNEEPAGMYTPLSQGDARFVSIALRSDEQPLSLASMVRDEVMALDPDLPIYSVGTVRAGIKDQTWMYWVFGGLYAILGLGLGIGLAAWLSFMMAGMLYETDPFDPAIFLVIIATLAGTALLACLIPARRASRVDPLEALRSR